MSEPDRRQLEKPVAATGATEVDRHKVSFNGLKNGQL
jgi:hypothetical protein